MIVETVEWNVSKDGFINPTLILKPVSIGGVEIKEGQKIAALLGSANRDEAHFKHSDQMDITRDPNPHIGFGAGIHFCLGGPLARLEMGIALPKLVKAFPEMELAAEPIRRPTFVLRGYEKVEVKA